MRCMNAPFRTALDAPAGELVWLDDAMIDQVVAYSRESPRGRMIAPFHKSPDDPLHRMLNALQPHSYIRPHRHLDPPKAEAWVVLRGAVAFFMFAEDGTIRECARIGVSDQRRGVDLSPGCYHGLIALEPDTVLYEVKTGPYAAISDKAFAPFAPVEGTPEAEAYRLALLEAYEARQPSQKLSKAAPTHDSLTLLLISGSLRAGSSNAAALNTAKSLAPSGVTLRSFERMGELPHFNPDLEQSRLPEPVVDLRQQLAAADAVIVSTPEYAGALPGSFKNLLDWTVGEGLYQKPIGYLNASPYEGGAERTYQMLRVILGYVNADLVEAACVRAPVRRDAVDAQHTVTDPAVRATIATAVEALVEHVRARRREL
jgi:cupin fold WbuC family metalloprotein